MKQEFYPEWDHLSEGYGTVHKKKKKKKKKKKHKKATVPPGTIRTNGFFYRNVEAERVEGAGEKGGGWRRERGGGRKERMNGKKEWGGGRKKVAGRKEKTKGGRKETRGGRREKRGVRKGCFMNDYDWKTKYRNPFLTPPRNASVGHKPPPGHLRPHPPTIKIGIKGQKPPASKITNKCQIDPTWKRSRRNTEKLQK